MRLIDADALVERHCEDCTPSVIDECKHDPLCATLMWLADAPTIDPESLRPQGEWEDAEDGDGLVCPSCGVDFCVLANETERFNYCPNCGARMIGGTEHGR